MSEVLERGRVIEQFNETHEDKFNREDWCHLFPNPGDSRYEAWDISFCGGPKSPHQPVTYTKGAEKCPACEHPICPVCQLLDSL